MTKHSILFFNAENLYDTIDQPVIQDSDFTPEGEKKWTMERYNKKIADVADVICRASGRFPAIVGLAEVENVGVLNDLINNTDLKYGKYQIIHEHSPDVRGIDVALLYNPEIFKYLDHESICIDFSWNRHIKTREILYVKGTIDGKIVHLMVNHWPSRNKGAKETEEKRLHVADHVRKRIDLIFEDEESANIILIGDFNDEPEDKSLEYILRSKTHTDIEYDELYNLMSIDYKNHKGTNVYQRDWLLFDQIHVSQNFLNPNSPLSVSNNRGFIYSSKKVLYELKDGFKKPNETYGGDDKYYGGVSDHLAVYCFLETSS